MTELRLADRRVRVALLVILGLMVALAIVAVVHWPRPDPAPPTVAAVADSVLAPIQVGHTTAADSLLALADEAADQARSRAAHLDALVEALDRQRAENAALLATLPTRLHALPPDSLARRVAAVCRARGAC